MFVNRYVINSNTLPTGTTDTYINIPINMTFQVVDQAELVERVFVQTEVEKAINPILDYEKVRFLPLDLTGIHVDKITYGVNISGATNYAAIGFTDDDIKFERNNFKETFLNLAFYDTENALTQQLVSYITLFTEIKTTDLLPDIATQIINYGTQIGVPGQPKPAVDIPITFVLESPLLNPKGFGEGYHLYDYKDELNIGDSKYLYMRASFKNAKTGKSTNLMVQSAAAPIDDLVHLLYTRYVLTRNTTGYYYEIDDTYQGLTGITGPNNVTYASNTAIINLYQIQAT
jgi:hypothetical protein